jgi:hypothetical protein
MVVEHCVIPDEHRGSAQMLRVRGNSAQPAVGSPLGVAGNLLEQCRLMRIGKWQNVRNASVLPIMDKLPPDYTTLDILS